MYDFKLILRGIWKDKNLSILILAGLSLAFCVSIPLACNIEFNKSFDRFHANPERIYNVYCDEIYHGTKDIYGELPLAFGEYIQQLFPEVEYMVRTKDASDVLISKDNNNNWKENVLWADPSFKDVFYIELLAGNKASFLSRPDEVYISESLSGKIFKDLNSVGKEIKMNGRAYTVAGIFKDYPANSHLKFSVLISLKSRIPNDDKYKWDSFEFLTYIKLKNQSDSKAFENKIQIFITKYWTSWVKENYNLDYVFNKENSIKIKLLPVSDIHLRGSFISSFEKESNTSVIYINLGIIVLLVLIAYFNLIGFAISKGKKHHFQLKVKRYLGASKPRIIRAFITENISYTCIAFIISLVSIVVIRRIHPPVLTNLIFSKFIFPVAVLFLFVIVIAVISGLILGIYFNNISRNTKYNKNVSYSRFWVNRAMLVFQMAASIILLVCITSIFKQIKYISAYDIGINTENIVVVNHGNRIQNHYTAFKNELKNSPLVKEVSCSNSYPFNWMSTSSYTRAGSEDLVPYPFQYFRTDLGFQEVFDFEMTKGRWFSEEYSDDKNAIILNEEAVKVMRLKNPVGEEFYKTDSPSEKYHVIGVVNNFNFRSLHHIVEPLLLCPMKDDDWWSFIEIKGATNGREKLVAEIKRVWNKVSGNEYLDYTFLQDKINFLYEKEMKIKQSVSIFCLIAILISCFGLLGTVLNTTTEKTKEIGIRKVNGAHITEILTMLNADFIKWVAVAFVIACPISWYSMHTWLQNFAYKTELNWWIFGLAGLIAMAVALLTVSWQSYKTAIKNPVESLRYE
ncbi:MAG TPA: ABC transporter permease [Bacteroidales bacterium]